MTAEHCLRFPGAPDAPTVLFIPPLFDEANRMRRTLVRTMRALAARGTSAMLPDLPGQNDSLLPTEAATLSLWRDALAAIVAAEAAPVVVASWRGGALIDDGARHAIGWWRMVPVTGSSLVRTMVRTRIAGEKEAGRIVTADAIRSSAAANGSVELGGNVLSSAMLDALDSAVPAPVKPLRTVTIGNGDDQLPGTALWLRAEPGDDPAMAAAMAADIHDWALTCAAG